MSYVASIFHRHLPCLLLPYVTYLVVCALLSQDRSEKSVYVHDGYHRISEGTCCSGFFFFSSRRRHTRYWRDWSSDGSSDLPPPRFPVAATTTCSPRSKNTPSAFTGPPATRRIGSVGTAASTARPRSASPSSAMM